ncbi:kinase-like domain-containing protein [Thelephora terrestris]|uniref:Kinase-like domain-containing protein n=1 Tax=Thelephora terrestris TaxID=56493 RepID=A0A9P6HK16_9AGAM|nr:kinase-like domain-containing protein [Thelephora terrestris]
MLDGLDPAGQPFRKCLHILQKLCASKMMLPSSYEVSGKLSFNSTDAIAYGGFCDVYDGSLDLERVCVKRLRVSAAGDRALTKRSLCKEAVVWKHLDHPNIVPFKGVTFDPLQLVSKWIPGGELKEYVVRGSSQANLISLLLGVAKGLGYLHSRNVIHGDLKGANILIDANDNPRIVDFGLATVARDSDSLASTSGQMGTTARFTAPEILKGLGRPSKASDVFAFGMVVIEAFTGRVPFSGCIGFKAMTNILAGIHPERPIHPGLTDQLWTLTQQCWEEEPYDRPSIDSVIEQLSVPSSISRWVSYSSMTTEMLARYSTRLVRNQLSRTGLKFRKRASPR